MRRISVKDAQNILNELIELDSAAVANVVDLDFFISKGLQTHERASYRVNTFGTPVMSLLDVINFVFADASLRLRPSRDSHGALKGIKIVNELPGEAAHDRVFLEPEV